MKKVAIGLIVLFGLSCGMISRGADFNGDGTNDIGIFRSSSGLWAVRGVTRVYFGSSNDEPMPGDYNGDGTVDIGLFRASSGLWAVMGVTRAYFGGSNDEPLVGVMAAGTGGAGGGGKVEQVINSQTNAYISSTSTIPWDNTIPQQTEGVEVTTVSITPTSALSNLLIEATVNATEAANTANRVVVAVFRNDELNAIVAASTDVYGDLSNVIQTIPLKYMTTAGTTDPITFKIRAGIDAGTININGWGGSTVLGGSLYSTLTVTEIKQ